MESLAEVKTFFENFRPTDIASDPLPLKVLNHSIESFEVRGQSVYWAFQYLYQKNCPSILLTPLLKNFLEVLSETNLEPCFSEIQEALDEHDGANGEANGSMNDRRVSYQPLKLMQTVTNRIDAVCLNLKTLYEESQDVDVLDGIDGKLNVYDISFCTMKNTRRTLEDRMIILPNLDKVYESKFPASYFAVFDGHNGVEAAAYAAAQLHQNLILHNDDYPADIPAAIHKAFQITDRNFLDKCTKENIKSGATAVLALVGEKKIHVAWAGDSQVVLVKRSEIVSLVSPHKPEREDEMQRIRDVGGDVLLLSGIWRVNGNLAVSRAIGDYDYKNLIISTPEVKVVDRDDDDEFLILACDGLWDDISPQRSAQLVRNHLVKNGRDLEGLSQTLASEAKKEGCGDNITIIVVFLQPIETIIDRYSTVQEGTICLDVKVSGTPGGDWNKPKEYIEAIPNMLDTDALEIEKMDVSSNTIEDESRVSKESDFADTSASELNIALGTEEQDVDKLLDIEVLSQPDEDWKYEASYPSEVNATPLVNDEPDYMKNSNTNPFLQDDLSQEVNVLLDIPDVDEKNPMIDNKLIDAEVSSQPDTDWTFQTNFTETPVSLKINGESEVPATYTIHHTPDDLNECDLLKENEVIASFTPELIETENSQSLKEESEKKEELVDVNQSNDNCYGGIENQKDAVNFFEVENNDTMVFCENVVNAPQFFEEEVNTAPKLVLGTIESVFDQPDDNANIVPVAESNQNVENLILDDNFNPEISSAESKMTAETLSPENKMKDEFLGAQSQVAFDILDIKENLEAKILDAKDNVDAEILYVKDNADAEILNVADNVDAEILDVKSKMEEELFGSIDKLENEVTAVKVDILNAGKEETPDNSMTNANNINADSEVIENKVSETNFMASKLDAEILGTKDDVKETDGKVLEEVEKQTAENTKEEDLKLNSEILIEPLDEAIKIGNDIVTPASTNGAIEIEPKIVNEPVIEKKVLATTTSESKLGNEAKTSKAATNEKIKLGVKSQDAKKSTPVSGVKNLPATSTPAPIKRPVKSSPASIAKTSGLSPTTATASKPITSPSASTRVASAKPATTPSKPSTTSPRVSAKTLIVLHKPPAPASAKSSLSSTCSVAKPKLQDKKPPTSGTKTTDAAPKVRTNATTLAPRPPLKSALKTEGTPDVAKKEPKPIKAPSVATKTAPITKPPLPSTSRPKPIVAPSSSVPKPKPSSAPVGTVASSRTAASSAASSKVGTRKEGVAKPASTLNDKKPAKIDAAKTVPPIRKTVAKSITETKKVAVGSASNKLPASRPTAPKPAKDPKLPVKVSAPTTKKADALQLNGEVEVNTLGVSNPDATAMNGGLPGAEAMSHSKSISNAGEVLSNGGGSAMDSTKEEGEKLIDFGGSHGEEKDIVTNGSSVGDDVLHGSKEAPLLEF